MAIVNIAQRTAEWFEWRKEGITASMIPVIMGLSPYQTPYELWAELCGFKQPDDLSKNFHVQRGIQQEPEAREWYENETGKPYLPLCVEADHNPLFKASLDGLFGTTRALREVLEVKCPHEKIYNEILTLKDKAPTFRMYAAQVQWQINTSDSEKGKLFFYKRKAKPIGVAIARNDAFIAKAEEAALEFWELVQTKTPPKMIEGRDKVIYHKEVAQDDWDSHSSSYRLIEKQIQEKQLEIDALKSENNKHEDYLKSLIPTGMQTFTKEGIRVTKVTREGSTDYKKLISCIEEEFGITVTSEMYESCKRDESVSYRISDKGTTEDDQQHNDDSVKNDETLKQTETEETETTTLSKKATVEEVETAETAEAECEDDSTPLMPVSPDNFFNKSEQSVYF